MPKLRNGSKGDSYPGSPDYESGILPLSYCAPLVHKQYEVNFKEIHKRSHRSMYIYVLLDEAPKI